MCRMLYLAADRPAPRVARDAEAPAFHVDDLKPRDEAVRAQFSRPEVADLGAHSGCGCGFAISWWDYEEAAEDRVAGRESMHHLAAYLEGLAVAGAVELFSCWNGDEAAPAEHRAVVSPDDLREDSFRFLEKQHLKVVPRPGSARA